MPPHQDSRASRSLTGHLTPALPQLALWPRLSAQASLSLRNPLPLGWVSQARRNSVRAMLKWGLPSHTPFFRSPFHPQLQLKRKGPWQARGDSLCPANGDGPLTQLGLSDSLLKFTGEQLGSAGLGSRNYKVKRNLGDKAAQDHVEVKVGVRTH